MVVDAIFQALQIVAKTHVEGYGAPCERVVLCSCEQGITDALFAEPQMHGPQLRMLNVDVGCAVGGCGAHSGL